MWLTVRSAFWTVLLPGVVAGYVPWRFFGVDRTRVDWRSPVDLSGVLFLAGGVVLLLTCIVEFARRGRGTLSPADPPRRLVATGVYRYVRNPMYVAVTMILLAEAVLVRSPALVWYWAIWFVAVNVFVVAYEEPALRGQFGASYDEYTRAVGRWIPRLPRR